jgi:DNA-binding NarL/FixJ family response regulator
MKTNTSVLIVESHALMRRALVALLREARPDWHSEDVEGLAELRTRLLETSPTLVLIDPRLCGLNGLRELGHAFPRTTFVVLSDQDDRATVLACLEAGAQGYILKSSSQDQFIRALETILMGGMYAPASLSVTPIHPPVPVYRAAPQSNPVLSHLTERQRHVFELLAEGCATKTIARRLDLAVGTVKVHLAAIYRTLGASSRLEALAKAHRAYAAA